MNIPLYYTLQQCDKVTVESTTMPYMKSLYSCLNSMIGEGYTEDFKLTAKGIHSKRMNRTYEPHEIKIVNFFRFEGNSNPEDNVIMYILETADGQKGTLIKSCETYHEDIVESLFLPESKNLQSSS